MPLILNQTLTILRAPVGGDRRGSGVRDWSAAERIAVTDVSVQPGGQDEPAGFQQGREGDLREAAVTGWRVFARGDLDVRPTDRVELADGLVCEVVGRPARWPDPFTGAVHHVEFILRLVEG